MDKKAEPDVEEEPFGLGCALEMFSEWQEALHMINNYQNIYTEKSLNEKAYERFYFIIGQYKEQPHLLDPYIDQILGTSIDLIRSDVNMDVKHGVFQYLHVLVNVRGYKVIVRQLPHEVADFEAVLKMLEAQDYNDPDTWTTRYILLLWLSIIVMIPFHLSRFDGFTETDTEKTVMCRVLDQIKQYIVVPDKCRDAAAYLSARFITRNDVKEKHLSEYLNWTMSLSSSLDISVFAKEGTLSSVAMILKHGKREDLLPHAQKLLQWIITDDVKANSGTNVQKLIYKIVQRIGLVFLPPRIATWRYQRGNRSLTANLCGDGSPLTPSSDNSVSQSEENIDVPDEIEEVFDQLIQGLRSSDGIVRWSAAKGVGRVTGRLPKQLADEVFGSILELFSPREGDGAWHGGCLSLAELGRRGLLLPKHLNEVVPVVLKALVYDEPRGYSSVGSHIRDAACYVCWSFARAYDKNDLQPFVKDIAATLLIVTCFDREINCRRAASAAFQENVGRQGTFPNGIDILTVADFFSVSVRNNAYLKISPFIAQFDDYTIPLIDHLLNRKVDHWDYVIRELTAKTLHNLATWAPEYMMNIVLPGLFTKTESIDLNSRHGSVLAIGEIINAIYGEITLSEDIIGKLENLVSEFRRKLYFRGLGGELMRQACCDFIEKCALAKVVFLHGAVSEDWLVLINECIAYTVPAIQSLAIIALPVFLSHYFPSDPMTSLVKKYIHEMNNATLQEVKMGHALALGALPKSVLAPNSSIIIHALIKSLDISSATQKWAESRRDALRALTNLSVTLSDEIGTNVFPEEEIFKIFNVLLNGLADYTQDKRGDVGAWVRESSVQGLQTLTSAVAERAPHFLTGEFITKMMGGIAQQAVERIDRTRALAGKVFYNLIYNDRILFDFSQLLALFPRDECDQLNWNSAGVTFTKFVELLGFEDYSYPVMMGLISSVGGLTETLVKNSSTAVFEYLNKIKKEKGVEEVDRLCDVIFKIFEDNKRNDRITIPLFRFLDKLLSSGCIQHIIDNPTSDFPKKTLKLILMEISGCKDVYKLVDGINALAQFIQVKSDICQSAIVQLSILLCHRQTYIRKTTASILYEALLIYGDTANIKTDNIDEIMQILSDTNWEESVDIVKPLRNQICDLFGVKTPVARPRQ